MGRLGITQRDVEEAALQLQGRGKNPTVDAVREFLGSGSKSTIIQHLKTWKSRVAEAQGKLPPELLALVSGLWERLNSQADIRITEAAEVSNFKIDEIQQELLNYQKDNVELNNKYRQSEADLHIACDKNLAYEKEIQILQKEHAALSAKYETHMQQLSDQKAENARLHHLATNIQANLEHYQAAIQQTRAEQNMLLEKQQAQFQQKINEMQKELTFQYQQTQAFELQFMQKNTEFLQLNNQYEIMQCNHEHALQKMQKYSSEIVLYKERCEQSEQQLQLYKSELTSKVQQNLTLEKQLAILNDKYANLSVATEDLKDKIELLNQDKLFLIQEKSHIEGCLKQLMKKDKGEK